MAAKLSGALQENLLALLCFDPDSGPLIRNSIDYGLFEGDYQGIAARTYDYIDRFNTVPGEHLPDLFEDILEGKDDRKASRYAHTLGNLLDINEGINSEYVLSQLTKFVRQQTLKTAIVNAANEVNKGTDEALDEAEVILNDATKTQLQQFNAGIKLTDTANSLSFLDRQTSVIATGIPELDRYNLGPARKELWLFIGLMKRGKTWAMVHLGKHAMMQRYRVCHITLEMSEELIAQRYLQAFFAIPKRQGKYTHIAFKKDSLNRVFDLDELEITPKLAFDDKRIRQKLKSKITKHGLMLDKLVVKQFPDGTLTINALKVYLDNLERTGFIPDMLIVDYPDKMRIDSSRYRIDLGRHFVDLRGIGVERNMAVATPTQANRPGIKAKTVDESNVAEDISKVAIADLVLTYSQTDLEHELGLARLYVAAGRNDKDKFTILISQDYATGQFVLESADMSKKYWELVRGDTT